MDRRRFIQGAAGSLAAVSGITGIARAQTPRRGGTLRIGMSAASTTDTLDPTTYLDLNTFTMGFTLGNNLVEMTSEKEPIPELAEEWDSSDRSSRWAFRIRKGVEFHNGKTLTPADVVYSLNRHRAENSKSLSKSFLANVTDIRADGQNVLIEMSQGDADIPAIMAVWGMQITPEGHERWDRYVGTGPYRLEGFEAGEIFKASRNRNYWKSDRAWFDNVEFIAMPDLKEREEALLARRVDAIDRVNFLTFDRFRESPDHIAVESEGARYVTMAMDVRKKPFSDPKVREAMKLLTSRQDIIDKVLGYATVANDHPVPASDPFHHSELPQRPYDPKRARALLADAGFDTLRLSLSASETAFAGGLDAATLMQDFAAAGNIDLRVVQEQADGYWTNVWMQKPFVESFWNMRPTPGMMFAVAFTCGGPSAEAFWCNDQFMSALAAARVETDFQKRKQHFWDLQEICHRDSGNIIPAFMSDLDIFSNKLGGIGRDRFSRLMGLRIAERAWFA